MTPEHDQLTRATGRLDDVLANTITGTRERPRPTTLVDLALAHAEAWLSVAMPSDGLRGGSSHPTHIDDQIEIARLGRQVAHDVVRLPEICKAIDALSVELYRMVVRLTQVIDHDKLPSNNGTPGCKSCARKDGVRGGHFEPTYPKAKRAGLCRWCYDYTAAVGQWPPVLACDIRHRLGPRHATLWLQKQQAMAV